MAQDTYQPSTRLPPPHSTTTIAQKQPAVHRRPSARDIVNAASSSKTGAGTFVSPLTRLEAEGRSRAGSTSTSTNATYSHPALNAFHNQAESSSSNPPPVPALDFNLFRTNSVYSVDSVASTFSQSDYGDSSGSNDHSSIANDDGEEGSPSTPKASTATSSGRSYFDSNAGIAQSSPSRASQTSRNTDRGVLTPKRSFVVPSRQHITSPDHSHDKLSSTHVASQRSDFHLQPVPGRARNRARSDAAAHTRDVPQPLQPEQMDTHADWASVHGEQGSEWGEDESQFEWVDTDGAPEAVNGDGRDAHGSGMSPSKRLSKLKAVVVGGEGQKKLRKPLVFPRRAAPPPPPNSTDSRSSFETISAPPNTRNISKAISHPAMLIAKDRQHSHQPSAAHVPQHPHPVDPRRPAMMTRWTNEGTSGIALQPSHSQDVFAPPTAPFARGAPTPLMVPMKDDGTSPSSPKMKRGDIRNSHMSYQSVAYSFYELDGSSSSPSTPKPEGDLVFPHGKYVKVSASTLEREREMRERTMSEPSRGTVNVYGEGGRTPEDFVHAGIEARGKGDMAKSAWYFMKAAEGGSPTGRMYWGLSLRHGWGVAQDDRHAFVELRQACDESLAEGGFNFHQSPGAVKLTALQKKNMTKDLSVGLFEVGNCFLEGVGVKRAPDVALAYLRFAANMGDLASQEQLGFVLSKGANGVKKDMKEAAKWYRMAISQGSSNTFGLAWVWKDKYMT